MADLGSQKIGSNYQKLLSIDGGEIQDGSGSAPTANLNLTGHITASGNISSSGTIYASSFDNVVATNITASGNISASGTSHFFNLPTTEPLTTGSLWVSGSGVGAASGSGYIMVAGIHG